ncbi:hypothetical protein EON64_01080 [archaeon]|nr:MAG: hypothetical protein EON64_01080 [archaeon]
MHQACSESTEHENSAMPAGESKEEVKRPVYDVYDDVWYMVYSKQAYHHHFAEFPSDYSGGFS